MEASQIAIAQGVGAQLPWHLALPCTHPRQLRGPRGSSGRMPSGEDGEGPRSLHFLPHWGGTRPGPHLTPGPEVRQAARVCVYLCVLEPRCALADRGGVLTRGQEGTSRSCPWRGDTVVRALLMRSQGWWGRGHVHVHMRTFAWGHGCRQGACGRRGCPEMGQVWGVARGLGALSWGFFLGGVTCHLRYRKLSLEWCPGSWAGRRGASSHVLDELPRDMDLHQDMGSRELEGACGSGSPRSPPFMTPSVGGGAPVEEQIRGEG